jgi:hypothetical protein
MEDSIFSPMISNGFVKINPYLFCHLHVHLKECKLPLTWWKAHEAQFPNVAFVACQMFGILGLQIET